MGQPSSTQSRTEDEKKLRLTLLLMDTTVDGKPSRDTSTAGYGASSVSSWGKSQTEEGNIRCLELERFSLNVVVGPCLKDLLLDTVNSMQRVIKTLNRALVNSGKGFDAILLVFRFDASTSITQEDVSVLENLKVILGKNYLKHVIVRTIWPPFTGSQCSFDIWCRKQEGPFQKLFDACNNRCVLVNTFEGGEEREIADINHLAKLAYTLRSLHGCYTANYYKLFAPDREKLIITLKKPMLKAKTKREADILFEKINEFRRQRLEYLAADQRYRELLHEVRGPCLLNELIKIIQEVKKAEGNPRNVQSNMNERLLTETIEDFVHRLENTLRVRISEFSNMEDATYLWNKIQEVINILNEMHSLRSTIDKYERVRDKNHMEIFDAIRELRLEITREDRCYGQLKDLMDTVLQLENYFRSIYKTPSERQTQTTKDSLDWDKINIAVSVLGKAISAAAPSLSIPITVLTTAVDVIGSNVMK